MLSLQVVIGVGLLAAVSYAVKQFVAPKVSQWYHEWRQDDDKAKAEEEQQKTAQLVADAIQGQVGLICSILCKFRAWEDVAELASLCTVKQHQSKANHALTHLQCCLGGAARL